MRSTRDITPTFHKKAEFTDMEPCRTRQLDAFYSRVLGKSRLQWKMPESAGSARETGEKPHLVYVADMEGERKDVLVKRHAPDQGWVMGKDILLKPTTQL